MGLLKSTREGRSQVVFWFLFLGNLAWVTGSKFVLKEHFGVPEYIFHGALFVAALYLYDDEKMDRFLKRARGFVPFTKGNGATQPTLPAYDPTKDR